MQWVLASKQHLLCVFIRLEEEKAKAKAQAQAAARLKIQDEVQKLLEEEKASYQQTLADAIRREKLNVQDEHLITQYYVSQLLRTVMCCLFMCISVYMFLNVWTAAFVSMQFFCKALITKICWCHTMKIQKINRKNTFKNKQTLVIMSKTLN